MGDAYWKYEQHQHQQQQQQQQQQQLMGKRQRSDYDVSGGRDLPGYFSREDERGTHTHLVVKDSDTIGASYDRYLRVAQLPPFGGIEATRPINAGLGGRLQEDPRLMGMGLAGMDLAAAAAAAAKARDTGLAGGRPEIALPPDASNTLFVEGLPSNCSRREVAHIFRPFVGYKEVRLVTKESRHSSGDALVLCFVDFESPAEAATAKDALHAKVQVFIPKPAHKRGRSSFPMEFLDTSNEGYKFDEHDRDSGILRMQFARNPGVRTGGSGRSGGRSRGRR